MLRLKAFATYIDVIWCCSSVMHTLLLQHCAVLIYFTQRAAAPWWVSLQYNRLSSHPTVLHAGQPSRPPAGTDHSTAGSSSSIMLLLTCFLMAIARAASIASPLGEYAAIYEGGSSELRTLTFAPNAETGEYAETSLKFMVKLKIKCNLASPRLRGLVT
jgi:hypothetical protein